MKKNILGVLCALFTFLLCLPVLAGEAALTGTFSYYSSGAGVPTMLYTLQQGEIKVHADVHQTGAGSQEVRLVAKVRKDGQDLQTYQSDAITLKSGETTYLAVDVTVPDDGCVIESALVDHAGNPLAEAAPFQKESTVVVPDPGNLTQPLSQTVTLSVNGKAVPVRREEIQGMQEGGSRDIASKYFNVAKVSVKAEEALILALRGINGTVITDPLQVSPRELKLPRVVSKGVGYVFLPGPQTVVIRDWANRTGDGYEDLIILVTPLETDVPYKYAENITYYAPGVKDCPSNPAFQENEFVYFDQGFHQNVGTLALKPGMKLYMAPGAVLEAKIETKDVTENPNGIQVYGRGILEARKASNTGNIKGIYFENCSNVQIQGIGLRNPREWQSLYLNCSNFVIDQMNIMGIVINNDGIDLEAVDHFTITNNFVMAGDDCFGWHGVDYEKIATAEFPYGRPTYEVHAQNNILMNFTAGNPIRVGSSMEQEAFRNITIKDTYAVEVTGYAVAVTVRDWAAVSDILIENYFAENCGTNGVLLVEVAQGTFSRTADKKQLPAGLPSPAGSIKDLTIKNFKAPWNGVKPPIVTGAYDEDHKITNLVLDSFLIQTGTPVYTGGQNTAPVQRDQIQKNPSTSGDETVYVQDSDIILK